MFNLYEQLTPWVKQYLGIELQKHQELRIKRELEKYSVDHQLTDIEIQKKVERGEKSTRDAIIDIVTVQESYFFRDQSLFNFLRYDYLPMLIQKKIEKNDYSIQIWSAGCSHGEELYSIAILLHELLPNYQKWNVSLLGSDLNAYAVSQAQQAHYTKNALRTMDAALVDQYFTKIEDNRFVLKPHFKEGVVFKQDNLTKSMAESNKFDIIFCRNVFIYFSQAAIDKSLMIFENSLLEHGHLFLGPSDFLSFTKHQLHSYFEKGVTYYGKSVKSKDVIKTEQSSLGTSYVEEQENMATLLQSIKAQLEISPKQALLLIDEYNTQYKSSALLYQYKAQALRALGDIETAKTFCQQAGQLNEKNPQVYLLQGLIAIETSEIPQAITAFEKCIALKENCIEAYYYLAQLLISQDEKSKAYTNLIKASRYAEKKETDYQLFGFEGESLADFKVALAQDLEYLQKEITQ